MWPPKLPSIFPRVFGNFQEADRSISHAWRYRFPKIATGNGTILVSLPMFYAGHRWYMLTTQKAWYKAFLVFLHTNSSMSEALAASGPKSPCCRAFMDMQWCMWRSKVVTDWAGVPEATPAPNVTVIHE